MIKPDSDSAQIEYPPPFAVLVTLIGAIFFKLLWPTPFLPTSIRWVPGSCLVLAGITLMFSCARLFKKFGTHIEPWKSTSTVLRQGPYRYTRNPIYLSFLLFCGGVVFLLDNAGAFILLVPLFLFLNQYVIPREERYLKRKFGMEYQQFFDSTRRWL